MIGSSVKPAEIYRERSACHGVISAKAGDLRLKLLDKTEVPAFAGMTLWEERPLPEEAAPSPYCALRTRMTTSTWLTFMPLGASGRAANSTELAGMSIIRCSSST